MRKNRIWDNPRSRVILPIVGLIIALMLTVTYSMERNAADLDLRFGRGQPTIIKVEESSVLDADYYSIDGLSSKQVRQLASSVSQTISDEGIVLLKNDGLLPLSSETTITPLGLRFIQPYYGGTGSVAISTAPGDVTTPEEGLRRSFPRLLDKAVTLQKQCADKPQIWKSVRPVDNAQKANVLYELPTDSLAEIAPDCIGTVGIVYIGRQTGEYAEACATVYEDGTPHMLALTTAEHALIDFAKTHCRNVIVALCCSSAMQVPELAADERVSAILWMGGAGSTGYDSLASILIGEINPSGHLPVSFAADFTKDPSYANHDDGSERFTYANVTTTQITSKELIQKQHAAFHEYEEGIYVGYKYYETACALGYPQDVTYHFGHGLSYTQFSQQFISVELENDYVTAKVKVTNMGDRAGKSVVQLYVERPYTESDRQLHVEKSAVDLMQFAKTALLAPNESCYIHLSFPVQAMASYCTESVYHGGYRLCAGCYRVSIRLDSHHVLDSAFIELKDERWFTLEATNRFSEMNRYAMGETSGMQCLSRAAWTDTMPTAPTELDRQAHESISASILSNDAAYADRTGESLSVAPVSEKQYGVVLADLRGRAYDDPLWDVLLDQLDFSQTDALTNTLLRGMIYLPATRAYDGPQGLTLADVSGKNWLNNKCGYPGTPVMASTWNASLMYALGESVGREALVAGIHGWYAPGLNIVRSPFCGRVVEYFSEDPRLSGLMGMQVVSGAGDQGLICSLKHFPIMEAETHRGLNTCTWMTEQTMRELYLLPFELIVKGANKVVAYYEGKDVRSMSFKKMPAGCFLMVADSAIGSSWVGICREMLHAIVREEWGFEGAIITDMHQVSTPLMVNSALAAGCDVFMTTQAKLSLPVQEFENPETQTNMRRALKNLSYTFVNSNLMQYMPPSAKVEYRMSPWRFWMFTVDMLIALACVIGFLSCFERRKVPDERLNEVTV